MRFPILAAAAAVLSVLSAPSLAADTAAGKAIAQSMCAVCHGADGIAKIPDGPNLAGETAIYLSNQLKAFRGGQRQHEQMSIIASGLSDEDIANLAAWYASFEVTVAVPQQ